MVVKLKDFSVYRVYDFKLKATLQGKEMIVENLKLVHDDCITIDSTLFKNRKGPIDLSEFVQETNTNGVEFNYKYYIEGLSVTNTPRCPK